MKILGLTGKAGAGKDYVYETVDAALHTNEAVRRMAFADGVKIDIQESIASGRDLVMLWEKPYSDEVRSLLQWWGTDYRREQDPDFWVKRGVEQLNLLRKYGTDIVCVTDVRFQNEVDIIHQMGGIVVEVVAAATIRAQRLNITEEKQAAMSTHATERGNLQNLDGTVMNDTFPHWNIGVNEYLGLPVSFRPEERDTRLRYGQ